MADEQIITPPAAADNGAQPEVVVPAAPAEGQPAVVPQAEPELSELELKVRDQAAHLRASREEALRLKAENDALKAAPQPSADNGQQINPADVEAFKALAKAAGIDYTDQITQLKTQTYREKQDEILHDFLVKHPEYASSDEAWKELREELTLYRAPENAKDWQKLLDKAHKARVSSPETLREQGRSLGMAQAKLQEKESIGSPSSGGSAPPEKKQNAEKTAILEGFAAVAKKY